MLCCVINCHSLCDSFSSKHWIRFASFPMLAPGGVRIFYNPQCSVCFPCGSCHSKNSLLWQRAMDSATCCVLSGLILPLQLSKGLPWVVLGPRFCVLLSVQDQHGECSHPRGREMSLSGLLAKDITEYSPIINARLV